MPADTSPVKAPSASQWTFCAATAISVPASCWTAAASDTYGGLTTTSTPARSRSLRARQNSAVSAGPLYIFQLPAISMGAPILRLGDRGDARQLLALQQLE